MSGKPFVAALFAVSFLTAGSCNAVVSPHESSYKDVRASRGAYSSGDARAWSKGEKISLYSADGTGVFYLKKGEGEDEAVFNGKLTTAQGGNCRAFYPQGSSSVSSSGKLRFQVPSSQRYVDGGIDKAVDYGLATGSMGEVLRFEKCFGLLSVPVPQGGTSTGVRLIDSDASAKLWGTFETDDESAPVPVDGGDNSITLAFDSPQDLSKIANVRFAVPPGTLGKGFRVEILSEDSILWDYAGTTTEIEAGKVSTAVLEFTGEGNARLESMTLLTASGPVPGEIDEDAGIVYFRHIHDGSSVTGAEVLAVDGGFLADDLGSLYGSWPERTVIGLSDGKGIRKYQVVLSDFVAPGDPYLPSGNDWKLVWNDEFAAPGIDWKSWRHCSRGTPDWNKHMSTREDLSFVSSGNAVLKAIVNDDLASDPDEYLTGGITGQALKSFRLGRIDVRARFDMAKAFWPAIWLMPQASIRWPAGGEIDIMEHINYEYRIHQSVHSTYTESVSKQDPVSSVNTECSVDGYHVYSVEMHEGYLVFRLDDTPTFIYRKDASKNAQFPFENYPYFVILSAQLGGKWPGQPDGTGLPAAIYIDYVRVFEKQAGDASQPEDPVVIPPSSTEGSSTIEPLEEITY